MCCKATASSGIAALTPVAGTAGLIASCAIGGGALGKGQGTRLLKAPAMQNHHIFPQKYRDWFAKRGINIDNYTVSLSSATHLAGVHGKGGFVGPGNANLPGRWNQRWDQWIRNNPNASAKEIFQFGGSLMDEFGLNKLPIVPYK